MSVMRRAIRSAIWMFADDWLNLVWGIVSMAILARVLGPEVFGVLAIASISLGIGAIFLGETITEGLIQFEDLKDEHSNASFWFNLGLATVFAIGVSLLAEPLSRFFGTPILADILPIMALIGWMGALGDVPEALLERNLEHNKLVILENVIGLPCSLLTIVLALSGYGVWSIILSSAISTGLSAIGLFWMSGWRPGLSFSRKAWLDVTRFGRDTLATKILGYVDDALPRLAIGYVLGERALGLYSIAINLAGQVSGLIMGPLSDLAMSVVARLQTDLGQIRALLNDAFSVTTFIMYPAILGAALVAPIAAPLLLGPAWAGIETPLVIAILIGLRHATGDFNISILRGLGDTLSPLYILSAGIVVLVVGLPIAMPFGLIGITSLVAIRVFATWPLSAWFVQRRSGYPMINQFFIGWRALAVALLMTATLAAFMRLALVDSLGPVGLLATVISLGLVLYSSIFAMVWPKQMQTGIARVRAILRDDESEDTMTEPAGNSVDREELEPK